MQQGYGSGTLAPQKKLFSIGIPKYRKYEQQQSYAQPMQPQPHGQPMQPQSYGQPMQQQAFGQHHS